MRACLVALTLLAAAPAAAADALPVIGWQAELHACTGETCRVLVIPMEPGSAKYPCDAFAAALQERAEARLADAPAAEPGPVTVRAFCRPIRGLASA